MTTDAVPEVLLGARHISKRFGATQANDDISISVAPGQVVALLGENGAGKSTLVNVLFGLHRPDDGEVVIADEVVELTSPADAIARGVGMVHQHFQLVSPMSVVKNVVLGAEPRQLGGFVNVGEARRRLLALQERFGLYVDVDANVEDLPVGSQQRVEILKALYRDARVLILDEPTAVLTPQETDQLLSVLRGLTADGLGIVFITHKLPEALGVADEIVVLRGGKQVASVVPSDVDEAKLAELMVGRAVHGVNAERVSSAGDVVLNVEGLVVEDERGHAACDGLGLTVRAGQIVGVAGVEGNGQRELVEAITGLRHPISGTVTVCGQSVRGASPRKVATIGVGHVPEDRRKHGLIDAYSVADNSVLNSYHREPYARFGVRQRAAIDEHAQQVVVDFDVRTSSIHAAADSLSGGNQQKLVVGREFSQDIELLVVAQPTRGIDVGAIEFIHSQIVSMRDAGVAVLLVSAELDEVLALSDVIAVVHSGKVVGTIDAADAERERIGLLMAGAA